MTELPLHPALVHLPLGLALGTPLLAIAVLYAWSSGRLARFAWWLVVGAQVLVAGGAFAALKTGEQEEERVEDFVPHEAVHEHEEAAEFFLGSSTVALAVMVAAGLLADERRARAVAAAAVAAGLFAATTGLRTGHLGGQLVYLHGAAGSPDEAAGTPTPEEEGE